MTVRVRLAESAPWTGGYSSAAVPDGWPLGEVRAVAPGLATYLTSTFPTCFVVHSDPPAADRSSAPRAPAGSEPSIDPGPILAAVPRQLAAELAAGAHDAILDLLASAEASGRNRKTVTAAIAARREALAAPKG